MDKTSGQNCPHYNSQLCTVFFSPTSTVSTFSPHPNSPIYFTAAILSSKLMDSLLYSVHRKGCFKNSISQVPRSKCKCCRLLFKSKIQQFTPVYEYHPYKNFSRPPYGNMEKKLESGLWGNFYFSAKDRRKRILGLSLSPNAKNIGN